MFLFIIYRYYLCCLLYLLAFHFLVRTFSSTIFKLFIDNEFQDVFLGQIHVDISNSLNSASQSLDAWKSVTDSDVLRGLQVRHT